MPSFQCHAGLPAPELHGRRILYHDRQSDGTAGRNMLPRKFPQVDFAANRQYTPSTG